MLPPLWLLCAWPALITAQAFSITTDATQNVGPTSTIARQSTQNAASSTANGQPSSGVQTATTLGGVTVNPSSTSSVSVTSSAATISASGFTASGSGSATSAAGGGSSTSTSTSGGSSSPSSGLTSNAKIGIGVGVGVGLAALFAALAFFLITRRRRENSRRYGQAHSVEKLREIPVTKDAAPPFISSGGMGGGISNLSHRASNRSGRSTSGNQAQPPAHVPVSLPPRSPRLSFEEQPTREGNRPPQPSIFTEALSPVEGGHPDDHEPVSPVSSISEMGSRPPSPT